MLIDISGFRKTETLYEGSHSYVCRMQSETDNQAIIFKLLNKEYPKEFELARFKREYEITRSLKGKGGIQVFGLQKYKNTLLMQFEDFGGQSLDRLLPFHPPDLLKAVVLAVKITEIIGRIHQQNIIHKNINPSNILWNPETDQMAIIDFGISSELTRETPEINNPGILEGTLDYMSPEQTSRMNRSMDYRTDMYSLGVTLYEMLTGQLPFQAKDAMELVHSHIAMTPTPPPYS